MHNKYIMEYLRISKLLCTFAVELRNMFNQLLIWKILKSYWKNTSFVGTHAEYDKINCRTI